MTSKKFLRLLTVAAMGTSAVMTYREIKQKISQKISREEYIREGIIAEEVLQKFIEANQLVNPFKYASDSGTVPIYVYDTNDYNLEEMVVPEGYVLHKLIRDTGAVYYALGEGVTEIDGKSYYSVLLYLDDAEEWKELLDDFEEDE